MTILTLLAIIHLFVIQTTTCMGRGPHHPRGQTVAKHHVHYRPTRGAEATHEKITQDDQLLHDREHIQEDLGDLAHQTNITAMTDEELDFHYFKLHDFDNNNQLDGLEILQAIQHTMPHPNEDSPGHMNEHSEDVYQYDFDYYVEMIDRVFAEDDVNFDGFLSYPEYVAGKKKDVGVKVIEEFGKMTT